MNSIGVDFKLKSIEIDGKIIKLQIVSKKNIYRKLLLIINIYSGIPRGKSVSEQSQLHIIKEPKE